MLDISCSGHKVSAERLKLVAENVSNIVIVTGDADQIVNPDRSKDLHDMLPVGFMTFCCFKLRRLYVLTGLSVRGASTSSYWEVDSKHR